MAKGRTGESEEGKTPGESRSIPRIEETLSIGKKGVEENRLYINKRVVNEDVSEDVHLVHDEVQLERVPVNRYVDSIPDVRHEGDTMIIPVVKEVLVVEKKLMLVEEIRVIRTKKHETVSVKETLRKEQVDITESNDGKAGE